MGSHAKVENLSDGRTIKRNQAFRRVQQCISAWVEEGRTIRNLSVAEMVFARTSHAYLAEPLPFAEQPGLIYRPPEYAQASDRQCRRLTKQATSLQFDSLGT